MNFIVMQSFRFRQSNCSINEPFGFVQKFFYFS